MTEEQKPEEVARCKFCGGPGKILESHAILHEYWGYCDSCRARTTYFMTREEALKAWNREAPNAELERLREMEQTRCKALGRTKDSETDDLLEYLEDSLLRDVGQEKTRLAIHALCAEVNRLRPLERAVINMRQFKVLTLVWQLNYDIVGLLSGEKAYQPREEINDDKREMKETRQ